MLLRCNIFWRSDITLWPNISQIVIFLAESFSPLGKRHVFWMEWSMGTHYVCYFSHTKWAHHNKLSFHSSYRLLPAWNRVCTIWEVDVLTWWRVPVTCNRSLMIRMQRKLCRTERKQSVRRYGILLCILVGTWTFGQRGAYKVTLVVCS